MPGILMGLLTAATWATGSILMRDLARKLDPFTLNAPRALIGGLAVFLVALATGRSAGYRAITDEQMLLMVGSMMVGGGLGDSLYTASLARIGVARSYPIANAYPALTMLLGVAFLGETISIGMVAGLVFVLGGIYVISNPRSAGDDPAVQGGRSGGVLMAVLASLFWALAMILVAPGTKGLDAVMVASIRVPALSLALFGVVAIRRTWPQLRTLSTREWVIMVAGGLIGWGLGSTLFVITIGMLGATRTAIITSASPLFALPLSVVFLKERVNWAVLMGTACTVVGVILVAQA